MYSWKLPPINLSPIGCIIFNWNSDALFFFKTETWPVQYDFENVFFQPQFRRVVYFHIKMWRVLKNLIQKMTR